MGVGVTDRPKPTHEFVRYIGPDGESRVDFADGREVCDFCLTPDPPWEYPAAPMPITGHYLISRSDDSFGLCDTCHQLVQIGNIGRLVRWICEEQKRQMPAGTLLPDGFVAYPSLSIMLVQVRENVLRFLDARSGPPVRVGAQHEREP